MPLIERSYCRMAFSMDYRDSELFHLLEDTVRRQVRHMTDMMCSTCVCAQTPHSHTHTEHRTRLP